MDSDIQNLIGNEWMRVQIQNHPQLPAFRARLWPHALEMLDIILVQDLTAAQIYYCQSVPDEEWEEVQFLRIIGGGNPDPRKMPDLTSVTLCDILFHLREFSKTEK